MDGVTGEQPQGMVWIPAGDFLMGSDSHYPEEAPVRKATVEGFWMDQTAVTNRDFEKFVEETGYVTVAERPPDPAMFPGADPAQLVPGSITFFMPPGPVDMGNPGNWWRWTPGASWRQPWGPGSDLEGKDEHPVTQVAWEDVDAYARWVGKELPREADWERAARGGLEGAEFAWGDELSPGGVEAMNRWVGEFPWQFVETDTSRSVPDTVPVKSFPGNGFGLCEITGNTWEWTRTWFNEDRAAQGSGGCCGTVEGSREPGSGIPRKVLKGGSFLCAENYCSRYRPSARIPQTVDSATCHTSFRCIKRPS